MDLCLASRFGRWIHLLRFSPGKALVRREVNPLSHLYPFICSSTHLFIPSPTRVNTERWGHGDNSEHCMALAHVATDIRAPGASGVMRRVPLGAVGKEERAG